MSVLGSPTYNRGLVNSDTLQKQSVTENTTMVLPANTYIQNIIVQNNTANIVLGGLKFGTTDGGTDIVTELAVGANALLGTLPLKTVFSRTATQTIYINAVTGWNGASVDIVIIYGRLP